ncbi:MAG: hypothetical protein AABY11_02860 [archaeon]
MALQFSDVQKKICQSLLDGPLSLETLAQRTQLTPASVQVELKHLMQLKLIALQGTPPVYALKDVVVTELRRRKSIESEDDNLFRIQIVVEVQGIEEQLVKKQVEKVIENLRNEPFYRIYATTLADVVEVSPQKYSTFAEVNLSVRDFRALVRLMFFYGPASVEVIKPSKIEFTLGDFQDGLVDMTEMVHAYADYIMGILDRKKVAEFNTKFYEGLRHAQAVKEATPPADEESSSNRMLPF